MSSRLIYYFTVNSVFIVASVNYVAIQTMRNALFNLRLLLLQMIDCRVAVARQRRTIEFQGFL